MRSSAEVWRDAAKARPTWKAPAESLTISADPFLRAKVNDDGTAEVFGRKLTPEQAFSLSVWLNQTF